MSLREKKALALFAVLAVLMMTDKWHGINIGWIMMVVGFVGFLPGFDLVDGKKFATLNLTSVLFIVGCMSIGAAAQATGMDKSIARQCCPCCRARESWARSSPPSSPGRGSTSCSRRWPP